MYVRFVSFFSLTQQRHLGIRDDALTQTLGENQRMEKYRTCRPREPDLEWQARPWALACVSKEGSTNPNRFLRGRQWHLLAHNRDDSDMGDSTGGSCRKDSLLCMIVRYSNLWEASKLLVLGAACVAFILAPTSVHVFLSLVAREWITCIAHPPNNQYSLVAMFFHL